MNDRGNVPPVGRRYIEVPVKSALPIWTAAAVWIIAGFVFPLARLSYILLTAALSVVFAKIVKMLVPKETKKVEVPFSSGVKDLDTVIRELDRASDAIEQACNRLNGNRSTAGDCMRRIISWIGCIREELISEPEECKTIRRFVNYYLPTAVKISERFSEMAEKKQSGENLRTALDAMEETLCRIEDAFRRQYDALFANDVLDITTDLDVLEQMLRRDNLK